MLTFISLFLSVFMSHPCILSGRYVTHAWLPRERQQAPTAHALKPQSVPRTLELYDFRTKCSPSISFIQHVHFKAYVLMELSHLEGSVRLNAAKKQNQV